MVTFLFIIILIAFIGLGIPDSLLGTAWPVIYPELNIPVSAQSFISVATSILGMVSSIVSARVIKKIGTALTVAISTAMTAVGLLVFSLSGNLWVMLACAIPLGLGAGCVDAALNNYVALHYSATHMSFLHCFYGVGIMLSPYIMSFALDGGSWRQGYRNVFFIQTVIAVICFASLPLWRAVGRKNPPTAAEKNMKTLSARQILTTKKAWFIFALFFTSCGIECTAGAWCATYLVSAKGLEPAKAALIVTVYYLGMTTGRLLSGIVASRVRAWHIVFAGQTLIGVAMVLMLLPLGTAASAVGIFLVGCGNGPLYPNLVHLTPKNFGVENSASFMGAQMAAASIGTMTMTTLFGYIARAGGIAFFPAFLTVLFVIMVASEIAFKKIK